MALRALLIRSDIWGAAVRVLAPLGALLVEGWAAFLGAVIVQEGGLWLARRFADNGDRTADKCDPAADTCDRTAATRLFLAAYAVRMVIALPTHYVAKLGDGNGALFRDDYTNDLVGEWLVRIAHGDGGVAIFPGHQYLLSSIYSYLLMAIYAVFGYSPLLPKLLNISLAALSAVIIFDIARKIFSPRAALLAGIGAAVLPSLVVWSVATLKETLVLFTSVLGLWTLQFLSQASRRDPRAVDALVLLFGVGVLLLDLRAPITVILACLLGVIVITRARLRLRPLQIALATLVVAGVVVGSLVVVRLRTSDRPLSASLEDVVLQIRHRRAQEAAGAASQLRPEVDVVSATGSELPAAEAASDVEPFSFVGDVLNPLGYALLAPAPWQAQSLMELGASAEMPVWYVLLIASLLAWRGGMRQPLFAVCLVLYGVANWLILAAVEGNLGNLLRHRLMLEPSLLILGSAGLYWLWSRLMRHTPEPLQTDLVQV